MKNHPNTVHFTEDIRDFTVIAKIKILVDAIRIKDLQELGFKEGDRNIWYYEVFKDESLHKQLICSGDSLLYREDWTSIDKYNTVTLWNKNYAEQTITKHMLVLFINLIENGNGCVKT